MSTRSRANPWFRPVVPIAKAYVERVLQDAYEEQARATTRMLIRSRLDNKLVLQARLLDSEFDERVREVCPELPPIDPATTAELQRVLNEMRE